MSEQRNNTPTAIALVCPCCGYRVTTAYLMRYRLEVRANCQACEKTWLISIDLTNDSVTYVDEGGLMPPSSDLAEYA